MTLVVDSHQHFWDRTMTELDHSWQEKPGLEKICRSFLPADLEPELRAAHVDRTVFVQTQHDVAENRWALSLAGEHEFIAGVVGWVDLASEACEQQLEEFRGNPRFVGVRHVVQDEPDDDFIVRDDVSRGLAVLEKYDVPYDLLFYSKHLKHAATVARKFPELRLVIDHVSKPEIADPGFEGERFEQWRTQLFAAAKCPNVYCKLSGLVTEARHDSWTVEDLRPCFDSALDAFGADRCMFGSDWPVCELAASYADVFAALTECIGSLTSDERAAILGGNAVRFYGLVV